MAETMIPLTKPCSYKASSNSDAVAKVSGRVKAPGKPPTSPKSSGMKKSGK